MGTVTAGEIARNIVGSIVKEDAADIAVLKEYATLVAGKRDLKNKEWQEFSARPSLRSAATKEFIFSKGYKKGVHP